MIFGQPVQQLKPVDTQRQCGIISSIMIGTVGRNILYNVHF